MARRKTTPPKPSKETGQISLQLPDFLQRILPLWNTPEWMEAKKWRRVVANIPLATVCRETLIQNIIALDWKVEPRDSEKRDELRSEIDYYTKLYGYDGNYDYVDRSEYILKDVLDTPFGGAVETGREGDTEDGKVIWIEPIDAATLFPSPSHEYPVGQALEEDPLHTVYFPKHAINRIYVSPRTEIRRHGWGMPPPEKIYLAANLVYRGDQYYANLLLDTPEVGILDLGNISKASAQEWVKSWKNLLDGIDPFKIPVLYEHDSEAKFISFTRSPTELMFDKALGIFYVLVTAGYGISPSDVGLQGASAGGGDTLAGSIRQERKTRKTGVALLKKKMKYFYDRMLPKSLEFKFIDLDDEVSVALGRARLANATSFQLLIDKGVFIPNEARQQMIADGLITISVPESIEGGDKVPEPQNGSQQRPDLLGKPVSPSQGGYGEVRSTIIEDEISGILDSDNSILLRLVRGAIKTVYHEAQLLAVEYGLLNEGNISSEEEIELYSKTLRNLIKLDKWYSFNNDNFKHILAHNLVQVFKPTILSRLAEKYRSKYEKGEMDELITENFEEAEVVLDTFKSKVQENAEKFGIILMDFIENCVLDGTRKYLFEIENVNKVALGLDTEVFMGDNVVECIKEEIALNNNRVIQESATIISSIITEVLEE